MLLRWGIASVGKISHDFAVALSTLPEDEHKITAVAAREITRAEEFAKTFEASKFYGSYQELAEDKNIDIVYVGVIHPYHYDVALLMLENNKKVLCEKPLCINEKQCRKLITYSERKKLFLMEGVWSRYFPSYQYIKKQISSGVLGDIRNVEVSFGFDLMKIERMQKKDLGGGTVLDLGIYAIQICQWVINEPPIKIIAKGELNEDKVDVFVDAELHYSGGALAKIQTSSKGLLSNTAIVKGTKGEITIKNFWSPLTIVDFDGVEKTWTLPDSKHKSNFVNSIGLRFEAEEARKCIMEGKLQSEHMTHNDSILLAQIEDEIRKQIGVTYDVD